jgi:hypothetical protein
MPKLTTEIMSDNIYASVPDKVKPTLNFTSIAKLYVKMLVANGCGRWLFVSLNGSVKTLRISTG